MNYLELARAGKNEWWRYLLAFFAILGSWLTISIVAGLILFALVYLDNDPSTNLEIKTGRITGLDPAVTFLLLMTAPVALFVSVLATTRVIHQRGMRTLVTPLERIDWGRVAFGFGLFLGLAALGSALEAVIFPGRYEWTFRPVEFLKILPLVMIFIPLQTAGEELVFRGYLMQALSLHIRQPFIVAVISSLLFMAMHLGNPEMNADALLLPAYYFGIGLLFALVTIKDNRLELALGAHAATNMFTALIANYTMSALQTPSIFTANVLDARFGFATFIVMAVVFYAIVWAQRRTPSSC